MLPGCGHVEHDDRQLVVHAERDRGRVHHLEAAVEHLEVAHLVELHRVGIEAGIGAVHAVDTRVRALQDRLGTDLGRAQRGGGVGGEVRVAVPGREDHDPALLEVTDRAQRDVRLGDLRHRDRGLHAGRLADGFERVLQRERVDHGGEHAHVVGAGPVHAARRAGHARARCCRRPRRPRSRLRDRARASVTSPAMRCTTSASMWSPVRAVGERLARELQHHPAVLALDSSTRSWRRRNATSSPILTRAKRRSVAPPPRPSTSLPIVCFGSFTNPARAATTSL